MNRHSTVRLTRREALQAGGAFAAGALLERFRAATRGYAQQPTTSPAEYDLWITRFKGPGGSAGRG